MRFRGEPATRAIPQGGFPYNRRRARQRQQQLSELHKTDRPQFDSFREFYPFYLSEHANRSSRRLHFTGTALVLVTALVALLQMQPAWLWLLPVFGYGFAWLGHFGCEKNRPATFRHPFYSLAGDFAMFRDMLTGRIPF
jgi:hypothetical protein